MACIVKLGRNRGKGIVVFTTIEHDFYISRSSLLYRAIYALRKVWLIGLHHNASYVNSNFIPDSLFDFHIAGPGDISNSQGPAFYQIPMDSSSFSPDCFEDPGKNSDKFWDLLFISRNVPFKSVEDFFLIARKIFDKKNIRILAIISHENLHLKGVGPSETIKMYLKYFNGGERRYFTLMTPSIDYPFPFDLPTLAFFYHHSKVFLHVARHERHPRVASYAFAANLPVIAPKDTASALPLNLHRPPGFWEYNNLEEAVNNVLEALKVEFSDNDKELFKRFYLNRYSIPRFKTEILNLFHSFNLATTDDGWLLNDLDIRIARHHASRQGPNFVPMALLNFSRILKEPGFISYKEGVDFEQDLCKQHTMKMTVQDLQINFQVGLRTFISNLRDRLVYFISRFFMV